MIREFHQISLRERNSFRIEAHATRLIEFETENDLHKIFDNEPHERWMVLSGGNNILFTHHFDGLLLTPVARRIAILGERPDTVIVRAEAGIEWDNLVEWAVQRGLWGIENLSLIPGKAGAAPVQNIGAYGCELKDVIERVYFFDVESQSEGSLEAAECGFGYRNSIFKRALRGKVVITAIDIRLSRTPSPRLGYGDVEREVEARGGVSLRNIREAICTIRRAKLPDPDVLGNAGSFFKNPVVDRSVAERLRQQWPDIPLYPAEEGVDKCKLAAGWLIEKAGLKGFSQGRAGVHDHQALVLVNLGGATGREVLDLAHTVQRHVNDKFGIKIATEVTIL